MVKQFLLIIGFLFSIQVMSQTGIGTTTPHASAKLDITSTDKGFLPPRMTASQRTSIGSPENGLIVYQTDGTPGLYYFNGTSWIYIINSTTNVLSVINGGTGTNTGSITGTGALTLTAGGTNQNITLTPSGTGNSILYNNVGIANTSPSDRLVVGASIAMHDGGDKVIGMGWSPGSGNTIVAGFPAEIRLNINSGKLSFGTDPTSRLVGVSAGVQRRMTITSAGDVGIGTESPNVKLQVNGDIIANSIAGSSDLRFKTNIKNIESPLTKVIQLRGVIFNWKTNEFIDRNFSNKRSLGFIAQEVEKVIPELVETEKTKEGFKSIQYDKVVALLVEAIKEQQKQIDTLNNKVNKLIKKISK